MNIKYVLVLISLLGIFLLYVLSLFSQPPTIALQDLQHNEGKKVVVDGIVLSYHLTSYGSQLIEIRDINATDSGYKATVFSQAESPVEYGDHISVIGTVQKYNGEWEVVTDNERSIFIIQKWQNISTPLWQLAQNPERYAGTHVCVTGVADQLSDDSFYLNDPEGKYSLLALFNHSLTSSFSVGDTISVQATFAYDEKNLRYVLQTQDEPTPFNVLSEE